MRYERPLNNVRDKMTIDRLRQAVDACLRDKHALEEYEKRYAALVENKMTGVFIHDGERFVFVNKQFARMFNMAPLKFDEVTIKHLCPTERMAAVMLEGSGVEEVVEWTRNDGKTIWLKVSSTRLMCGVKVVVVGVAVDISEQVLQNQALRSKEGRLHHLTEKLIRSHEGERKRLSSELQEEFAQRLSAIKFAIESIRYTLDGELDPEQSVQFDVVIGAIRESIEHLRTLSMELHPSLLDDFGLLTTIDWYCREFAHTYSDIQVVHRIYAKESDIPNDIKIPIFRIIQASFDNVIKHAAADRVELELSYDDGALELFVHDNGRGMSVIDAPADGEGAMLESISEHARIAHGRINVHSKSGYGTTITVKWSQCVN